MTPQEIKPTEPTLSPNVNTSPSPETPTPMDFTPPAQFKPAKSKKPLFMILAVVLVLAAGVGAYFMFGKKKDTKTSTPVATVAAKKPIDLIRIGDVDSKYNAVYPELSDAIGYEFDIARAEFEPLVRFEDTNKIVPALAASWKNESGSETKWLFTLKGNVKFHNGNALTSDAVKLSIEEQEKSDFVGGYLDNIASVEAVGTNQVRITTKEADPLLLNKLANVLIYDTKGAKKNDPSNGTGPYVVKEGTTPTEKALNLVAVKDWYGGVIGTKEIKYANYATEDDLAKAAKAKELDVVHFQDTSLNFTDPKTYGLSTVLNPAIDASLLLPNTLKKDTPVAKLKVRQAIALAIDREALAKSATGTTVSLDQLVPKAIPGFIPGYSASKRDVTKAKALLTEAGYANGIKIKLLTIAGVKDVAATITTQLAEAGITVTASTPDKGLIAGINTDNFDLSLLGYTSDLVDASDVVTTLFQGNSSTVHVYTNPAVDEAMKKVNTTLDAKARLTALQGVHKTLLDDVAAIPFRSKQDTFFVRDTINYKNDYSAGLMGVYFWKTYQK